MKSPLPGLVLLIPSQTTSPCCLTSSVIVFSRAWRLETGQLGLIHSSTTTLPL